MYGYIYLTTNLVNGKKYIGQHRADGFDSTYYGSGVAFIKALKKYGKDNFDRILLKECYSEEELNSEEQRIIAEHDAVKSTDYYNIAEGGEGGNCLSGKKDAEIQDIVSRWRISMNSRTAEEREKTYQQWLASYNDHTPEEVEERRQRHSTACKKLHESRTAEQEKEITKKAVQTKLNWSDEQRASASANYTAANMRRWENMTAENLKKRTENYKKTRSNQSPERRAELAEAARVKALQHWESLSDEQKEAQKQRQKDSWKHKSPEEKQKFSVKCSASAKGRIWVHNDKKETLIKSHLLQEYMEKGYTKGRKRT